MGFKGTKEGWYKLSNEGVITDDCFWVEIGPTNKRIAEVKGIHYGIDNTEALYNAQLISKAPKMLDMLLKIRNKQPINTKQLDRLIKEATII